MRIAVCDDMKDELDVVSNYIEKYLKNAIIIRYEDGNKLICDHQNQSYDLIVMDVLMPAINGMDAAEKIRKFDSNTPIIFITTSQEFAVKSYRVLAFDYILKPINEEQIKECLNRFLLTKLDTHTITVKYIGVDTKICINNIIYMESRLHNVIFHLIGGNNIEVTAKLSDYENLTKAYHFCRCHKSYIVNVANVSKISGIEYTMTNGDVIKISRTFSAQAKKAYFDYVFGGDRSE